MHAHSHRSHRRSTARLVTSTCAALATVASGIPPARANPDNPTVVRGTASFSATGPNLTVQASSGAFINWSGFNIAAGEKTTFVQPSPASVVWNRVDDPNPSQIFGHLEANGIVVLANQSGFYFGPNSFVKTAGLLVTAAPIAPPDFANASPWAITLTPPSASIVNLGHLEVANGGQAFLIAERVVNRGEIVAPEGNIGLVAGREVLLSERPDGRGLSARVRLPAGSVDNCGRLIADAGVIALQAQVINQDGVVQANSARERNGIIELVASDQAVLGAHSSMSARGDASGGSAGGSITIESAGTFADASGSTLSVAGGVGSRGGEVHLSAPQMAAVHSHLDGAGDGPANGGRLTLDPTDIVLSDNGDGSAGSGTVPPEAPPTTLQLNIGTAFAGFGQILLQATRDITLDRRWNLNASTGVNAPGSTLTLEAGRDVRIKSGGALVAGDGWSVSLTAGKDFTAGTVRPGIGSIFLDGSGSIETRDGSVQLLAGKDILANSGFVHTVAGGSITAQALSGNLNTGTRLGGFVFGAGGDGYSVDLAGLGGFSTGAGGDVTLKAGGDVKSLLPPSGGPQTDGGSGAFGAKAGNVQVEAGGSVFGHYVLRNGAGSIVAGADAGRINQQLALSLVAGTWTVTANTIGLQEVRNPNGIFNRAGNTDAPNRHRFDYAYDAGVVLNAADTVQLAGLALPRNPGTDEALPILYPPRLAISAGKGGIILGNNVTLFPSHPDDPHRVPQGNLQLTTTAQGPLRSSRDGTTVSLVMSDSDSRQYTGPNDFDPYTHGANLLYADNPKPLELTIGGSVRDLLVAVPKAATFKVGGDFYNSSFIGQNLRPTDTTLLQVGGQIFNRNEFTFVDQLPPTEQPDFYALLFAVNAPPVPFYFNPITRRLAMLGRLTDAEKTALLALQVKKLVGGQPVYDDYGHVVDWLGGQPLLDDQGNFVLEPAPRTFLSAAILNDLQNRSQDVPQNPSDGYQVGGPGTFSVRAASVELGISKGIVSAGPKYNPALAGVATRGADLDIRISGDLSMFASAIRTVNGGTLTVRADGAVTVGDADVPFNSETARGIFGVGGSDVTVSAGGDVLVAGSRIATYDGGNLLVHSDNGKVDAGVGASGYVRVERITVDPATGLIDSLTRAIPGSGLLATSFPGTDSGVGNIRIETPRGGIYANNGGVVQIALNDADTSKASVTLLAGSKDILGPNGKPVPQDIEAGDSGVIGGNILLDATGNIKGVIVARNNLNIDALQNVTVTAIASGGVNLSAGGNVSGTVVGLGNVSVAGGEVSGNILGGNVNVSGGSVSGQVGFAQTSVANASQQRAATDEDSTATGKKTADDDEKKRKDAARPLLSRTTSRVTVVLPNR